MRYRLALITGASSGLGKELAILLANKGIPLFLTGRNEIALRTLQSALTVPVFIHVADLSSPNDRAALLELIHAKTPDLVINNAGFGLYGDALTYPLQSQTDILEVNAKALLEITIEAARALIKKGQKGTILNVSSLAGSFVYPSFSVYAAAKAFATQFSRSFRKEVQPYGIDVLTVCPGQIQTPFRERASSQYAKITKERSMTASKAATLICQQIEKKKKYNVIDNRYKFLLFLSYLIPNFFLEKLLRKEIQKRSPKKCLHL